MKKLVLLGVLLLNTSAVALDTTAAQAQMLQRVFKNIDAFMAQVGATSEMNTYCRVLLNRFDDSAPKDGSVPFGVDYNQVKTQQELDTIIEVREAFETVFLKRCLSRAVQDLNYRP
jgi:hypothetical protein